MERRQTGTAERVWNSVNLMRQCGQQHLLLLRHFRSNHLPLHQNILPPLYNELFTD